MPITIFSKLSDNLSTNGKLFADVTFPFSVVHNNNASSCDFSNGFNKAKEWAFQWKVSFNASPLKQAQEAIFTRKL